MYAGLLSKWHSAIAVVYNVQPAVSNTADNSASLLAEDTALCALACRTALRLTMATLFALCMLALCMSVPCLLTWGLLGLQATPCQACPETPLPCTVAADQQAELPCKLPLQSCLSTLAHQSYLPSAFLWHTLCPANGLCCFHEAPLQYQQCPVGRDRDMDCLALSLHSVPTCLLTHASPLLFCQCCADAALAPSDCPPALNLFQP